MNKFFSIVATICVLVSCRPAKNIQTAIEKKDSVTTVILPPDDRTTKRNDTLNLIDATLAKLSSNRIDYRSFTGKVSVDYRGFDGKNYDFNVNVRMLKDSIIWLNVNAFMGIDVMRVIITRDSVKLMNKPDKIYTERTVGYLQEVTELPLDLKTLQDLIIGNPVFLDSNIVSYSTNNNLTSMLSLGAFFKNLITLSEPDKGLVRIKLDDVDAARNRTADLTYEAYETKRGFPFSTKRRILVTEQKRLDIKLDFKQYELNSEVSFPFSVPKNYKRN